MLRSRPPSLHQLPRVAASIPSSRRGPIERDRGFPAHDLPDFDGIERLWCSDTAEGPIEHVRREAGYFQVCYRCDTTRVRRLQALAMIEPVLPVGVPSGEHLPVMSLVSRFVKIATSFEVRLFRSTIGIPIAPAPWLGCKNEGTKLSNVALDRVAPGR